MKRVDEMRLFYTFSGFLYRNDQQIEAVSLYIQ